MRWFLRSIVRRALSVGCAVKTGSMRIFLQQLEHLGELQPARLELGQRGLDAAGLRAIAGLEEVAAAPADAMHLLGEIDRAEPHGEGARQVAGHLRRAAAQLYRQLGGGFLVAGAAPDR